MSEEEKGVVGENVKGVDYDSSSAEQMDYIPPDARLKRQLKNRHVAMIRFVETFSIFITMLMEILYCAVLEVR